MKKCIVTGATSMVGVALIEECVKNGVSVLAIVRKDSSKINRLPKSKYVHTVSCDLEDMRTLSLKENDFDVFYHFGWSHTDKLGRQSAELQAQNIAFSLEAVNLAQRMGCKKFVGAGSQAEYGIHLDKKTGPDSLLNPVNAYGVCKLAAGKLCSLAAIQRNMSFSWVRIFSLYGKYEMPGTLIQTILPALLRDERCPLTEGIQKWDYLYSADAGEAFFLVGQKCKGNQFYCLGSGQSRPLRDFLIEMKEIAESKSELGFGDIEYNQAGPLGMCANITMLQEDTGWSPRTSFADGIRYEIQRLKAGNTYK